MHFAAVECGWRGGWGGEMKRICGRWAESSKPRTVYKPGARLVSHGHAPNKSQSRGRKEAGFALVDFHALVPQTADKPAVSVHRPTQLGQHPPRGGAGVGPEGAAAVMEILGDEHVRGEGGQPPDKGVRIGEGKHRRHA